MPRCFDFDRRTAARLHAGAAAAAGLTFSDRMSLKLDYLELSILRLAVIHLTRLSASASSMTDFLIL